MSNSVVFQTFSETGDFGVDFSILAAAVIRVLVAQGIKAFVRDEGLEGLAWSSAYGVPQASDDDLAECEVLLRAWPVGQWPERPSGPLTVVDFVRRPADRSQSADFTVAFEADGTTDVPGLIVWDVLFPMPIEINSVEKSIIGGTIIIHLGQDPDARMSGVFSAIDGFAGMSSVGLRYPDATPGPGITATAEPWAYMASGDVAVVTPEFPFRLAAAMKIPAVLVASTADEMARCEELVRRGHSSFLYLGLLSGLTNNQIRDAARDFRNDDSAKRIARLAGSEQQADQGVKRVADWVGRELIGRGLRRDPYQIQGYDTVLDAYTALPDNAAGTIPDESIGTPEAEVDVQVFEADGTWTKPDGAKLVVVRMVGGGGGGGTGRRGAAGTNRGGGGGGAGGAVSEGHFTAESLSPTVAITVGQGGIGGAGVITNDTSGNPGAVGTPSDFGGLIAANGGNFGAAGTNLAGGAGGAALSQGPTSRGTRATNTAGGTGGNFGGGAFSFPVSTSIGGGGGGGGAGVTNANNDGAAGGTGTASGRFSAGSAGGATGLAGAPGQDVLFGEPFGGSGGGGGGASASAASAEGGHGGLYGGGGGGSGACVNGFDVPAGGNGGNGVVVVTTYF